MSLGILLLAMLLLSGKLAQTSCCVRRCSVVARSLHVLNVGGIPNPLLATAGLHP